MDVDIDISDAPITIIRADCENLFDTPPTLSLGLESGRGRQLLPAAGGNVNIYRGTGDTAQEVTCSRCGLLLPCHLSCRASRSMSTETDAGLFKLRSMLGLLEDKSQKVLKTH